MNKLNESTGMDIVQRYLWFITYGVYTHTLNDPKVIQRKATPEYIDRLIQEGMSQWPNGEQEEEEDDDDDAPRLA